MLSLGLRRDGSRRVDPPALHGRSRGRRGRAVEIDEVQPAREVDFHERVRRRSWRPSRIGRVYRASLVSRAVIVVIGFIQVIAHAVDAIESSCTVPPGSSQVKSCLARRRKGQGNLWSDPIVPGHLVALRTIRFG
jgi:hypothetical protein